MPVDLILVRHGQSEANVIQKRRKLDPKSTTPRGAILEFGSYSDEDLLDMAAKHPNLLESQ